MSRKSSSRRKITPHSCRQSRQRTPISSSRAYIGEATLRVEHGTSPTWPAFHPVAQGHPWPLRRHPHPLQRDDKGLVPGLLGYRPPARLAHDTIVHFQHSQHLACRARAGAQGRPGMRVLCCPSVPCIPLLTSQLASTTLLPGLAPKPALGGAPGQRSRRRTAGHSCQQLLTAQEVDLKCPCGEHGGTSSGAIFPLPPPTGP